ncbi:ribonuclease H-like domain-containing protein [Tanacetum coccineum]
MWMYATISPKLVEMIVDVDSTAHSVWKRLQDLFHDNKDARITQLDNEIRNMAIGTSSITDFFQQIKSKVDCLADLDSPMKDTSLVTYAINGVRSKYSDVVRIIRLREKALTFDDLWPLMLLEESDMSQSSHGNSLFHNTSSSPTVLVAPTIKTDKSNTMSTSGLEVCRNFQRGSCTYGARFKFVHKDNDLRTRSTGNNNTKGAPLHTKPTGRPAATYPGPYAYSAQATMLPHAFQTMTLQDLAWNMDTGASSHLADDTGEIIECEAHNAEIVNPCSTPVDTESKLGSDGDPQVCLYMHDPREPHFIALKRILRYVRGTLDFGLQLHVSSTAQLTAFTDADWAGCPVTLSRSSVEAEYHGVANVVAETAWLRNLLLELHALITTATLVYCDNFSAVYLSTNPVQHQRTKHIEIDIHCVRDYVASDQVRVIHVPFRFQYANIFTKGFPNALFLEFRFSLNVRPPPVPTAGEY